MTAPTESAGPPAPVDETLKSNRLGIAGIVFFVVAAAAPAVPIGNWAKSSARA